MLLSVKFNQYSIRFHVQNGATYIVQDIKNTKTNVYLHRFSQEYINLICSNDVRDTIMDCIIYDINQTQIEADAQQRAEQERNAQAHAVSITQFYAHPRWNDDNNCRD